MILIYANIIIGILCIYIIGRIIGWRKGYVNGYTQGYEDATEDMLYVIREKTVS